ncbi:hypothetical protein QPM17_22025 [Marinobacter sp. TBZ242]|uniref:Uncharacterized protein n=1 Tax=Marinobacter azerbaijanicus TaxID=3050455 RepID=A0ABT7II33_9GAMM|nr:hypothetical protein [Marinobacter sp. TBZ242]MDL0433823.1 hypothetical protein [Marinobacter sp. TBZ242]
MKREPETSYEVYELEVGTFEIRMSAGIRATAAPSALGGVLDQPLHSSHMQIDIAAKCLFPLQFEDVECGVFLYSSGSDEEWSRLRIPDVQRKDENGRPKYVERDGEMIPEFDSPRSIGYFDEEPHGSLFFNVYLPFYLVQEFRTALFLGHAPRIFIGVQRTENDRLIQTVDYSTPGMYELCPF